MKNNVARVFVLTLIVVVALLGMHYLPPITFENTVCKWFGWSPTAFNGGSLRQVDLLSDLRIDKETNKEELDSTLLANVNVQTVYADSISNDTTKENTIVFKDTVPVPDSLITIADYSHDSLQLGMDKFYEALQQVHNRPVRIAWLGDSFVEGDILTGNLRSMLQRRFGGCGVGYIDMSSQTSGFRQTVNHRASNWDVHSWQSSKQFDKKKQGLSKHYFIGRKGSYTEGSCRKFVYGTDSCQSVTVFFKSKGGDNFNLITNRDTCKIVTSNSNKLQYKTVNGNIKKAKIIVNKGDSSIFYGMTMDGNTGIELDNYSMRGNSGVPLSNVPANWISEFNQIRPYDLVIIQFGLNVANNKNIQYKPYIQGIKKVIDLIHKTMPQASIMVVSVGDRDYRGESGEMESMPGVQHLCLCQQQMAQEKGTGFWNLYAVMKTQGGMVNMVHSKPALANLDYTHINFRGGQVMAKKLCEAIIWGNEQYKRKKEFIKNYKESK